jgi:hypothetical protein
MLINCLRFSNTFVFLHTVTQHIKNLYVIYTESFSSFTDNRHASKYYQQCHDTAMSIPVFSFFKFKQGFLQHSLFSISSMCNYMLSSQKVPGIVVCTVMVWQRLPIHLQSRTLESTHLLHWSCQCWKHRQKASFGIFRTAVPLRPIFRLGNR